MEVFEEILKLNEKESLKSWLELCKNCGKTQEKVLKGIINKAQYTEFGKCYNFEDINSIEEFRENVPILEYDDISEYIERMADGEEDLLFPGRTSFFISTSGTTGNSKKIPENDLSLNAKSAVLKLRNAFLTKCVFEKVKNSSKLIGLLKEKGVDLKAIDSKSLLDKFHFYSVTSSSPNNKTKGGIDIGFASGKTFDNSIFAKRLAYPKEIMGLANGESIMYLSMLFALRYDDIVIITANNAGRFYSRVKYAQEHAEEIISDLRNGTISNRIILSSEERKVLEKYIEPCPEQANFLEDLLKRGKEYFIPKYYWKYLISCRFWLSGSVGVNVDKLKEYLDEDVLYFDVGYGASEAKINIPFESNTGSGTLAISSVFYEFIPVANSQSGDENVTENEIENGTKSEIENGNKKGNKNEKILTAAELKDGGEYEILLTNYAGLYRYPLHDIVRVNGFFGNTPNIEFISKSREILNIAQEKVPAPLVLDFLSEFIAENNGVLRQAQIYPNLADSNYDIFIELENTKKIELIDNFEELSLKFDNILRENFELYDRNRKFKSINQLNIYFMKMGWQDYLYDKREETGAPRSQIKLDSMIKELPSKDWILK